MSAYKGTFRTTIWLSVSEGSEEELDVVIRYEFTPGTPPSGHFGPPEDYDPGSGPELYVESVRIIRKQQDVVVPAWLRDVILTDALEDSIMSEAAEQMQAEYDRAMEIRAEEAREVF